MDKETKAPLPDEVRDEALKALHNLESNDYWRRGDFSDCYDKIRAHIAAQAEKIALLKGAARADEQRLQDAGHRVNINAGCDTPEMMADRILELEAENKRLREALAPFSAAAAKYQDIGKSPVADYIKKKTGLIAGYGTVFIKLCSDSTSPKNWFDAAEALAQTDGKAGE